MSPLTATILLMLAFTLCLLGCVLLALSQPRHWRAVLNDRKANPPMIAKLGWLLVIAALIPCILRDGGSFAALLWPLIFAASAFSTAMLLTYRPSWLRIVSAVLG